jgi:hypothetical protein
LAQRVAAVPVADRGGLQVEIEGPARLGTGEQIKGSFLKPTQVRCLGGLGRRLSARLQLAEQVRPLSQPLFRDVGRGVERLDAEPGPLSPC